MSPSYQRTAARPEDIVGRRQELEALRGWLDGARRGTGRLVLCTGEPGIGKTRLAQELAGLALAGGTAVAWGRCVETDGAPPFWPWRQVLRSLGVPPDTVLGGDVESPQDRFRLFEDMDEALRAAAARGGLVVVLDDIHWGDEPSLLVLRHVAGHIASAPVLVFATFRDVEPATVLPRFVPDLLRSPAAQRLDLRGFGLAEVREQLSASGARDLPAEADIVLDLTGGNPLFVREVARAMADGTWRPERPPRTVLDVVTARLGRLSPGCRRFVQAAAIVGRDFSLPLVAATVGEPVQSCLPLVDEAISHGLVERIGDPGELRFVHALMRDAVEASMTSADRTRLHRAVALAAEAEFGGDLSEHLSDIARHWIQLAPYGEAATARAWALRAAEEAGRRLAYEEAVRLYRAALAMEPASVTDGDRCRVLVALGRACYLAGDLNGCAEAAAAAAGAARSSGSPELLAEAALVLEAVPNPSVNALAKQLCEDALADLGSTGHQGLRSRLLAQRSHLAFYDGEQDRTVSLSAAALELARESGDDRALTDALHARKEASPGPAGRAERIRLAEEMLEVAQRTNSPRTAMWGRLWHIDTLVESGRLSAAAEQLALLAVAVQRVGGPVSAWHLDRVTACIAQAQGRYAEAAATGRRGFERMRTVEPAPATGAYFALQCALAGHIGISADSAAFVQRPFESPPRFRTMAQVSGALMRLYAGLVDGAAALYRQAGPIETWSLPAFFVLPGYVYAALCTAALSRYDDLAATEGGRAATQRQLDRPHVRDTLAHRVLAAERLQLFQHQPAGVGGRQAGRRRTHEPPDR